MKNKKEANWFIRATIVDKANGPEHKIVTTHGMYSHAAHHLLNVIGAERNLDPRIGFTKGNMSFQILPMKKQKKAVKPEVRAEHLHEEYSEFLKPRRTRQQILEDAMNKVKEKVTPDVSMKPPSGVALKKPSKIVPEPPETGTNKKTITGEKPNEIEMEPDLKRDDKQNHAVMEPSPGQTQAS